MAGISVKLPLKYDKIDGPYLLNKSYEETIKQNLKMLILTNPGEKLMDSKYGVGISGYLFENANQSIYRDIEAKIQEQVNKYLPFITIKNINFSSTETNNQIDSNEIAIQIEYEIQPLRKNDILQIIV
jgi:phage baseplate assembly protein W